MKARGASVAKAGKRGASGPRLWLAVLVTMIATVLAPANAALGIMLLLPTAMAWIADREPGRPTARVVLLFGLAAACVPFDTLWHTGGRLPTAVALATDVRILAIAWVAQAGGWLLTQLLPLLIGTWVEAQTQAQINRRAKRKAELLQEWSETP